MPQQLPESNLSVTERLVRLVVATDAGCKRSELIADIEVLNSVIDGPLTEPAQLGTAA